MSELKPCPHCGEANELYRGMRDMGRSGPFSIDCLGCGADFVPREGMDVVAAWNRRDETVLSQARAEGRREGLEEAAKVADSHPMRFAGQNEQTIRKSLSSAIRALAQKGKDEAVGDAIGSAWELSDETKAQIAAIDANRASAARNADKPMFQNYGAGSVAQKEGKDG